MLHLIILWASICSLSELFNDINPVFGESCDLNGEKWEKTKIMGSLPNLNELSAGYVDVDIQNDLFARAFKEKGITVDWSKKKGHKPIYQTRSLGSNPNSCVSNVTFPKKSSYDRVLFNTRRSRSVRSSSVIPCHPQSMGTNIHNFKHISRQASVTSSTGTSSVRKLIAVVRSTPSHLGPVYSRPLICQNFVALCLSHGIFTVAFIPIVILQGSISAWWPPNDIQNKGNDIETSFNSGSLLLAVLYFLAAVSALFSPFVAHRLGITKCLSACYVISTVFVAIHLYPKLYLLIPAYILMGLSTGHLNSSSITYLVMLASKLKFVLSEEEENEFQSKLESTKRESLAQKLFRGISFAQNVGLILGGFITYLIIQLNTTSTKNEKEERSLMNLFQNGKDNDRICGYESCPKSLLTSINELFNKSTGTSTKNTLVLPYRTSTILAGVFLGCCVVGTLVTILFIHRIRICYNHGPSEKSKFDNVFQTVAATFRDSKLTFITPLFIFIGIEQGFMFADFTKFYVVCVIGIQSTPLIFISLGLLQSIAGFTLSLLIHHIRRYFIIGVGFIFQACLLLVLIVWKPTSDDAALFYVISAAWGVCNAIWDTLSFCSLVSLFPDYWEFPLSHHFFFRFLGLSIAFAYHGYICTSIKLYIMCVMLLMAVFPYALLEMKLDSRQTRKSLVPDHWRR